MMSIHFSNCLVLLQKTNGRGLSLDSCISREAALGNQLRGGGLADWLKVNYEPEPLSNSCQIK